MRTILESRSKDPRLRQSSLTIALAGKFSVNQIDA